MEEVRGRVDAYLSSVGRSNNRRIIITGNREGSVAVNEGNPVGQGSQMVPTNSPNKLVPILGRIYRNTWSQLLPQRRRTFCLCLV